MQKCPLLDCSTLSVQTGSSYNIVASPAKYKQSRIPSRDTEINKSIQLHIHQCLKHLSWLGRSAMQAPSASPPRHEIYLIRDLRRRRASKMPYFQNEL
jgi:hypothetical protein